MRCAWLRLPWMRSQWTPWRVSWSARRFARCFVRVNVEDALEVAALHEGEEERELEVLRHGVDGLRDPDGGQRLPLDVHHDRILEHLLRELRDRRRHRRGEEERLAARRQVLEDAADVGEEAHVEHPVRLVEDEDLEARELRVREAEVVEEAPGRRDDHVDAAPERVLLRAHPDAAEDGRAGHRRVDGELLEVLVDLRRELARGREDERARRAARLRHEAVEDREDERGGLAAARHRAGEEVPALHRGRDGVELDGRRTGEAHLLDAAEEVGVETERGEGHVCEDRFPGPAACAHRSRAGSGGRGTMDRRRAIERTGAAVSHGEGGGGSCGVRGRDARARPSAGRQGLMDRRFRQTRVARTLSARPRGASSRRRRRAGS